jgi:nicotinate-nucleotide pyrophosphorylase (carboxylating)
MSDESYLQTFIQRSLEEDVGAGDYSSLACIPAGTTGKSVLKVKESGILSGVFVARSIFKYLDAEMELHQFMDDGDFMKPGDVAFEITGNVHALLKGERLALNCMQRMSGIATLTNKYVQKLSGYNTKLLDTRKTTPGLRFLEKAAVRTGGGYNHRMGLFDMIMLKDNHIDFCGGIAQAIEKADQYLKKNNLKLPVEVEVRTLEDVREVMKIGKVDRIMFDNFSPKLTIEAVKMVGGKYETESSGNITLDTIESYAGTGVDFVSTGAITHHAVSLDLSLKATFP